MNWDRYQSKASNPDIGMCVNWHVSSNRSENSLRLWVERHLKYVAVRPWSELDMDAGDEAHSFYDRTTYWVHYHVTNDEHNGQYIRSTHDTRSEEDDSPDTPVNCATPTVNAIFNTLIQWQNSYWSAQPGEHLVVVDSVIRERKVCDDNRLLWECYDIYLPPPSSYVLN